MMDISRVDQAGYQVKARKFLAPKQPDYASRFAPLHSQRKISIYNIYSIK